MSKLCWVSYKVDIGCQSDLLVLKRPQNYHLVPHSRETGLVGGRKQSFPYFLQTILSPQHRAYIAWSLIIFLALNCTIHEGQLLFNKDYVYASR